MGMTALHTYALVTWLPTMFQDAGFGVGTSPALLSLLASFGLVGALVVPQLVLRFHWGFRIVVICTVLLIVGYVGMLLATSQGAVLWVIALGLGINTFPLCLTLIGPRARSAREATSTSGIVQGIGYAIGCAGPLLLGILNENTGSWPSAYEFLLATLLITIVAGWFATRAPKNGDNGEETRP